jgi:hypothetical protein
MPSEAAEKHDSYHGIASGTPEELCFHKRLYRLLKNSDFILALKGRGFSRAAKSFVLVMPSCPQPRLRGEDGEGSAFFSSFF